MTGPMGGDVCQFLPWDSDFFQCRIARATVSRLTDDLAACIVDWCDAHAIDCLYFLADPSDAATIRLAQQHGCSLVDVRVLLGRQLDTEISPQARVSRICVRPVAVDDIPSLRAIAKVSHRDSRFCFDSNFEAGRAALMFEIWIEKSCHGYADAVLVAEVEGRSVGYVTCQLQEGSNGQIGLCGVASEAQGQGIGHRLVQGALQWFLDRGVKRVTVVTQGRNSAAQRLYQRCGFVTESMHLWYHWWLRARR